MVLLVFAGCIHGQSSLPDGPKINGIGLGAKHVEIVRKLGKPTRDIKNRAVDECIGSRVRTLHYPGLKIELFDHVRSVFTVFAFEITSPRWNVSGANIGNSPTAVQKLFGTRGRTTGKEGVETVWYYEMSQEGPGGTNFHFRNGKLAKVYSGYTMC